MVWSRNCHKKRGRQILVNLSNKVLHMNKHYLSASISSFLLLQVGVGLWLRLCEDWKRQRWKFGEPMGQTRCPSQHTLSFFFYFFFFWRTDKRNCTAGIWQTQTRYIVVRGWRRLGGRSRRRERDGIRKGMVLCESQIEDALRPNGYGYEFTQDFRLLNWSGLRQHIGDGTQHNYWTAGASGVCVTY